MTATYDDHRYTVESYCLGYMIVDHKDEVSGITSSICKVYDKKMADHICSLLNKTLSEQEIDL